MSPYTTTIVKESWALALMAAAGGALLALAVGVIRYMRLQYALGLPALPALP